MNLEQAVSVNLKIMALIASKYADMPALWPVTTETRYYHQLAKDSIKAKGALDNGGLDPSPKLNV